MGLPREWGTGGGPAASSAAAVVIVHGDTGWWLGVHNGHSGTGAALEASGAFDSARGLHAEWHVHNCQPFSTQEHPTGKTQFCG